MKKLITSILFLMLFSSCVVFDKGYIPPISFPIMYLKNTSSAPITIETYYFSKKVGAENLWKSQIIEPNENAVIMDWVYPTKIMIYQENIEVFQYNGSNDKLNEDAIFNTEKVKLVARPSDGNPEKYTYDAIPFDKYDFSWQKGLSRDSALCGDRHEFEFYE